MRSLTSRREEVAENVGGHTGFFKYTQQILVG